MFFINPFGHFQSLTLRKWISRDSSFKPQYPVMYVHKDLLFTFEDLEKVYERLPMTLFGTLYLLRTYAYELLMSCFILKANICS